MTGRRPAIRVRQAGGTAAAILRDDSPLTVAAVFARSFYCHDANGRWLCFLRDDLEPGPLHALASNWPARLSEHVSVGQVLAPGGHGRMAAPGLVVVCDGFREWLPSPFPPPDPALLPGSMARLRQAMRRLAPPGTLAGLLFGHGASGDDWQKTVLAETAAAAAVLKSWLSVPSGHSPGEAARSLLGLGQGLTPTGDDILAGTLVTLRALGRDREAGELADAVEAYGAGATNRISLAHLRAAAAGQGALPFHDVLVELLRGEENFEPCLGRIGAVGHSSGWDILTGIATTVESLEMLKKS